MKNVLIIILLIAFGAGLYVNFGMSQDIDQSDIISESTEGETDENAAESTNETSETSSENAREPASGEEALTFSQEALQERYTQAIENNEVLIIDVLLPSYYTDGFTETLAEQFGTNNVEFNRIDIDTNTVDLTELTVSENSDAVIIDALQVRDYNDEVLPDRDADNLTNAYLNIYNSDKVVYILGNPNVHEHENLANVLAEDQTSLVENDYFYIDNQDVSAEGDLYDYEADTFTQEVESQIAQSIYAYMTE